MTGNSSFAGRLPSRRRVTRGLLFGSLSLLTFAAARPAGAQAKVPPPKDNALLRFGARMIDDNVALLEGGFAELYGVRMETRIFSTGIDSREGLVAGQIDVAQLGEVPFLVALARAKEYIGVAASGAGGGKYGIVVRKDSDIQSFEQLKGRKVAIAVGSGQHSAFLGYAKKVGLNEKDFAILNSGDAEAIAAMQQGSVDAVAYWEPVVSILVQQGIARRLFSFKGHVCGAGYWVFRRQFAEEHPEVVDRFLAGLVHTFDAMQTNPKEISRLIARRMEAAGRRLPPEVFELSMQNVNWNPTITAGIRREIAATWENLSKSGRVKGGMPDWDKAIVSAHLERAIDLFRQSQGRDPKLQEPDSACA